MPIISYPVKSFHIPFVEDQPESFLADIVVAENEPRAKCISRVDTGGWVAASQTSSFLSERGGTEKETQRHTHVIICTLENTY